MGGGGGVVVVVWEGGTGIPFPSPRIAVLY